MGQFELSLDALLTVAFFGVGWYLLLPRGKVSTNNLTWKALGALAATVGIVLLASTFGSKLANTTNNLTFYLLAGVSVAAAVAMISSRNPVISALWFALVLLSNSGLYLLQGAEFLSAATVIIYAGAIIVTFLFVIMLAQPKGSAIYDNYSREPLLSCTAGVILCWTLLGSRNTGCPPTGSG
jgi:NADH-quinone oxidoreductase subunit J